MLKIGDRVIPTERCRIVWPYNDYGDGVGTIEVSDHYESFLVRWDGADVRCWYSHNLLSFCPNQLENK